MNESTAPTGARLLSTILNINLANVKLILSCVSLFRSFS